MSKKINQSIKAITEGGIFTAGYALLAIISRYLITGTDSLIYYFTPLLMAIYIARNKISYSIAVLAASITLSFLFVNPLIALMVIMPNIIIGFVFGCLEKYNKVKIIIVIRGRGKEEEAMKMMKNCMLCGKCTMVCPRGINTRHLLLSIWQIYKEEEA